MYTEAGNGFPVWSVQGFALTTCFFSSASSRDQPMAILES